MYQMIENPIASQIREIERLCNAVKPIVKIIDSPCQEWQRDMRFDIINRTVSELQTAIDVLKDKLISQR